MIRAGNREGGVLTADYTDERGPRFRQRDAGGCGRDGRAPLLHGWPHCKELTETQL